MKLMRWDRAGLLTLTLALSGGLLWAAPATGVVIDNAEGLVIGSEARCVQSRGIPIKEVPDNQVRLACLKDPVVQSACNPDGSHARAEAFRGWVGQLMEFKERCTSVGGAFAFGDPNFHEPSDSSFCSLAQPEIQYSEFETPMCNFVSRCPRVAVTCMKTEEILHSTPRFVALPGVPKPISLGSN